MAKVTWRKGDTHTVTLTGHPSEVESQFGGSEFLWKLADGQCMYAPKALQARLESGQFGDGDTVEIQRNTMGWDVRRAYRKPLGETGTHEPVSAPRAQVPEFYPAPRPDAPRNQPTALAEHVRGAHPMAVALQEAMHAARMAEFACSTEDVTKLAITIYIESGKARGARAA